MFHFFYMKKVAGFGHNFHCGSCFHFKTDSPDVWNNAEFLIMMKPEAARWRHLSNELECTKNLLQNFVKNISLSGLSSLNLKENSSALNY